ncbi:hypothetical protein GCM10010176_104550 [Nonomuraea spiralis]|nr:hypothetical protein GCM10010176_104550 [Nonomuraea spiralis]
MWRAFLRRFDIEHTFRLLNQTLCWTCPKIRDPRAADHWTWLILAVHAHPRPARSWQPTCAAPERSLLCCSICRPLVCVEGFGTCAPRPSALAGHRNPSGQDRGGHAGVAATNPPRATTFAPSPA